MKIVLDSSDGLSIGFLTEDYTWASFQSLLDVKASMVLHSIIAENLNQNKLDITNIKEVIYCSGPGSYTGMRLAKGFADILALENINKKSFYHFEIPKLCGISDYLWITNAFKNEYFVYESKNNSKSLIPDSKLDLYISKKKVFSNSEKLMEEHNIESTKDLVRKNPQLFSEIKSENELYYFRPENQEFKVSNK